MSPIAGQKLEMTLDDTLLDIEEVDYSLNPGRLL